MNRIREDEVKQALCKDQGNNAKLLSWTHQTLASKFDGSTSNIYSVAVKFGTASGEVREACYVAKLSPERAEKFEEGYEDFYSLIFTKECRFYTEVLPAISSVLREISIDPVCFPKCYFTTTEERNERLYLENLKNKGHVMQNKALGLDLPHTLLVMRELGKLHGASVILKSRLPVDLADKYNFYQTEWTDKFNLGCDWGGFMEQFINTALIMFEEIGDCEQVLAWLRKIRPEAWTKYREMIERKPPFDTIIHGDCWINNMFFRYNESGEPEDVTFFDLQGTRIASVALDLQHFLNLNVKGTVRRPHFDTIITTYYDSFHHTVTAAKVVVPFTLEQLRAEYAEKGFYGVLYSIMFLPCMLSSEDGSYVFEEEKIRQHTVKQMVHKNTLLRPTVLSVIEEWMDRGLIT